jgi:hypothetical protein
MRAKPVIFGLLLGALVVGVAGCSGPAPQPGVTFTLCPVASENGKVNPRGETQKFESADVEDVEKVTDGTSTITVQVRKTQYGKATFEITIPGQPPQLVQVRKGESKDVLPRGKHSKVGVRIAVEDAH